MQNSVSKHEPKINENILDNTNTQNYNVDTKILTAQKIMCA